MTSGKIGIAIKGSRFSLQHYMKTVNGRNILSDLIISSSPSLLSFMGQDLCINWKSPLPLPEGLPYQEFYEYRDDFLKILNYSDAELRNKNSIIRSHWPKNGPQWDGLAVVTGANGEQGALLIEAKSHTGEMKASMNAEPASAAKITGTFDMVQNKMGIISNEWTKEYYQLSNRIAFLYIMNEILEIPTWLVLVNFINDPFKPTTLKEWLIHYNLILRKMGINDSVKLLDRIIMVFPGGKGKE